MCCATIVQNYAGELDLDEVYNKFVRDASSWEARLIGECLISISTNLERRANR